MKSYHSRWGQAAAFLLIGFAGCGESPGAADRDPNGTCWSDTGCFSYLRDLCLAEDGNSFGHQSCAELGYTELCGALAVKPGASCLDNRNPPGECSGANAPCVKNSDCCANHLCVSFGDTTICAHECTSNSQCVSDCCADLDGGGGACGADSFCDPATSDPCGDCISSCSGLGIPGCCTGLGCICEDECAVSGCTPPAEFCCGPYDCICTTNCPY
jgi:hypothetical protein